MICRSRLPLSRASTPSRTGWMAYEAASPVLPTSGFLWICSYWAALRLSASLSAVSYSQGFRCKPPEPNESSLARARTLPYSLSAQMFAIVDIAGFQEKVQEGDALKVPLHDVKSGEKIIFEKVLLLSNGDALA